MSGNTTRFNLYGNRVNSTAVIGERPQLAGSHMVVALEGVYSHCRNVFKKDCYCIPPKLVLFPEFGWYAIAVFFKNASTSRVRGSMSEFA